MSASPELAVEPLQPLRLLLVEDSVDDAELISAALRRELPDARLERVETRAAFDRALIQGGWDAVVADFHLPQFSALEALTVLQQTGRELPLIVVSGLVGEEMAVSLVQSGAMDFVTKSNLKRLPSAITRAMREARLRRERREAQEETLRSREQLRELARHLERAKEEERTAIARDIHDELGVLLTAAKIEVATLARNMVPDRPDLESATGAIDSLIDRAMDASRQISRRLRPAILDHGVVAAIEWLARDFSKRVGIPCEFDPGTEDIALEPELATSVFRIFQEALTNVARHADARGVEVTLIEEPGRALILRVADDGRGFSADDLAKRGSFGLQGMRERAHAMGGELEIAPGDQGGTEVTLRVPLAPHAGEAKP